MVELVPPGPFGFVFATTDQPVDDLSVIVNGAGHSAISAFRDYLVPGHRTHVATVHGPATVTVASAGVMLVSESFDTTPVRRRVRANRPRRFGSPW